jgi:alginate O-acetyltransferase complex protein AlgJ
MVVGFRFPKSFLCALACSGALTALLPAAEAPKAPLSKTQRDFRGALATQYRALEKSGAAATTGADGWLFLAAELRFLSLDCFWGGEAAKVSRASKPDFADPIPAIVDFHKQLRARGIELLLVPVPPKAAIYPEKILPGFASGGEDAAPSLRHFYDELRAQGLEILDLTAPFLAHRGDERGPVFCRTDTHWSGVGCVLAAQAIREKIQSKLAAAGTKKTYEAEWKEVGIEGDLVGLLKPPASKPAREIVRVRAVSERATGAAVASDPNSPVLLLGDSHTLVFHDFLAERAGLLDQLALELGFAPEVIGTRGSGATPVRYSLSRRSAKEPDYLSKKKAVIWCFTAREFSEGAQGWPKVPMAAK